MSAPYQEHWSVPGWYRHEPNFSAIHLADAYAIFRDADDDAMPLDTRVEAMAALARELEKQRNRVSEFCAPWFEVAA
jgi:hypothetical protein